jgi:hypothetical protein
MSSSGLGSGDALAFLAWVYGMLEDISESSGKHRTKVNSLHELGKLL